MVGLRAVEPRECASSRASRAGGCRPGGSSSRRSTARPATPAPRAGGSVRTLHSGNQWSSASLTPVSCPSHASDPAQARGVLVLPLPLARLRPLGEPAVLDAGDARAGAGRGGSGARAGGARRGRRDGLHHRGHRGARGCGERDDARPVAAPAGALALQAGPRGLPAGAGRRREPPVRGRHVRPLRLRRLDRVLAGPAARHRRGLPRGANRCPRAGDRPGPPGQPRRPRAGRDLDALPGRRRSTAAGWRRRASRTSASSSSRRTGTATGAPRTRWRSAASSRGRARRRPRRRCRPSRRRAARASPSGSWPGRRRARCSSRSRPR